MDFIIHHSDTEITESFCVGSENRRKDVMTFSIEIVMKGIINKKYAFSVRK